MLYIFVKIKGSELNCILSASSVMIHHPFALFSVRNICSCSARLALGNLGAPEQLEGLIENGEFLKYQFQKNCWPCCPKPFKAEISNSLWDILTLLPLEGLNQKFKYRGCDWGVFWEVFFISTHISCVFWSCSPGWTKVICHNFVAAFKFPIKLFQSKV